MQDKTLACLECGNEFIFSADGQEFYSEQGLGLFLQRYVNDHMAYR